MKQLNMPEVGEKISDTDFVRWMNRAQAIVPSLQYLDISDQARAKLAIANEYMIAAMRAKTIAKNV